MQIFSNYQTNAQSNDPVHHCTCTCTNLDVCGVVVCVIICTGQTTSREKRRNENRRRRNRERPVGGCLSPLIRPLFHHLSPSPPPPPLSLLLCSPLLSFPSSPFLSPSLLSGKEGGEEEKDGSKEERKSVVRVSGCILHFSGVGSGKPRDDLKNELLPFGTVAFVDFPHGKTEVSSETEDITYGAL